MCGEARRSPASQFIHSSIAARRSSAAENRASGTGSGRAGKTGGGRARSGPSPPQPSPRRFEPLRDRDADHPREKGQQFGAEPGMEPPGAGACRCTADRPARRGRTRGAAAPATAPARRRRRTAPDRPAYRPAAARCARRRAARRCCPALSRWMPCRPRRPGGAAAFSTPIVTTSTSSSTARSVVTTCSSCSKLERGEDRERRLVDAALARQIAAARGKQGAVLESDPRQLAAQPLDLEMLEIPNHLPSPNSRTGPRSRLSASGWRSGNRDAGGDRPGHRGRRCSRGGHRRCQSSFALDLRLIARPVDHQRATPPCRGNGAVEWLDNH